MFKKKTKAVKPAPPREISSRQLIEAEEEVLRVKMNELGDRQYRLSKRLNCFHSRLKWSPCDSLTYGFYMQCLDCDQYLPVEHEVWLKFKEPSEV